MPPLACIETNRIVILLSIHWPYTNGRAATFGVAGKLHCCFLAHIQPLTHSPLAIATYSNHQAVLIGKFCYSNSAGSEKNHSEPGHYQSPRYK
jgi:hypothetical protein